MSTISISKFVPARFKRAAKNGWRLSPTKRLKRFLFLHTGGIIFGFVLLAIAVATVLIVKAYQSADRATARNNAVVLQEYGYPMELIEVGREATLVPFGSCPSIEVYVENDMPSIYPLITDTYATVSPSVGDTYQEALAKLDKLGYGYCKPGG